VELDIQLEDIEQEDIQLEDIQMKDIQMEDIQLVILQEMPLHLEVELLDNEKIIDLLKKLSKLIFQSIFGFKQI
jgi:hypothetical protein